MPRSMAAVFGKTRSKWAAEHRHAKVSDSDLNALERQLIALEQASSSSQQPLSILLPALFDFVEMSEVVLQVQATDAGETTTGSEFPDILKKISARYRDILQNSSSYDIGRLGSMALMSYIAQRYGVAADLERVEIYRHCLFVAMNKFQQAHGRDELRAGQLSHAMNEVRQVVSEWPPVHEVYVRLTRDFDNYTHLEVLPSCTYWDRSDQRWRKLRGQPQWDVLYRQTESTLRHESDTNGRMIVVSAILVVAALAVHWALLIVALPLALLSAFAIETRAHGFPVKDRFQALGGLLREACIKDRRLYEEFVPTGILRMRAISYGK